jgi:hypothetical protein
MEGIGRMPYQMPGAGGVMRSGMTPGAAMVGGMQIPGMPQAPMANMCGWEIMGGASWALYGGFFNGPEGVLQKAGFGFGMDNLMMDMQNRSVEMCLQYMVQQSVMQTNMNCAMMMHMAMMMDRINTLEAMLRNSSAATEKYMELIDKMMKHQAGKSQTVPQPPAPQPPAPQPPAPQLPAPQPPAPQPPAPQPTPVTQPQVKKEPSRQEKASAFVDSLKREGSSVSPQTMKALGRQHGLGENEVDWFIAWLSEVDSGKVDFTDKKVIEMCNIFVSAAGADGNMSKFARSLEMYSNSSVAKSDNLSKECYEALAFIAGSPEGWQTLRDQLGNISGWRWGGANMTRDDVRNQIRAWITG